MNRLTIKAMNRPTIKAEFAAMIDIGEPYGTLLETGTQIVWSPYQWHDALCGHRAQPDMWISVGQGHVGRPAADAFRRLTSADAWPRSPGEYSILSDWRNVAVAVTAGEGTS